MINIQKQPTLAEKQAFWAEQLPNFEAKYWLSDRAKFLVFDMEQGNYVVKDDLDPIYEDDANDTFHRVNTGWAMWKKAITFTKAQTVPEEFETWHFKKYFVQDADKSILYEKFKHKNEYVSYQVQHSSEAWQAAKAQAVPEGFVLVEKQQLAQLMADMDIFGKKALGDDYVSFADIATMLDEAQEQSHD